MKLLLFALCVAITPVANGQDAKTPPTLKAILLAQLRSTHNVKEWFVPANIAVAGLTAKQASWKDNHGNHSVKELADHLIFWDERSLVQFQGNKPPKFDGNNDETFKSPQSWDATVRKLDEVLTDWEKAIEAADDGKLNKWYATIAHIGTHNAYHIGEIIYVRREQGSWNPENGVH